MREALEGWTLASAAAQRLRSGLDPSRAAAFALEGGQLRQVEHASGAEIEWLPGRGWQSRLPAGDARGAWLELYLPFCGPRPCTVAQVGQSLDGCIATAHGESHYVTGPPSLEHLHRLRALCDAVIVGAGTVAADDPQLTTRLVAGPNPLRVVLDPNARLAATHRVFSDGVAPTWRVVGVHAELHPSAPPAGVQIVRIACGAGGIDPGEVLARLRAQGCERVLVEGGGITIARFLEAGHVDRLHVTVAPLLIGAGRRGLPIASPAALHAAVRYGARGLPLGDDVLFDCDLRASQAGNATRSS